MNTYTLESYKPDPRHSEDFEPEPLGSAIVYDDFETAMEGRVNGEYVSIELLKEGNQIHLVSEGVTLRIFCMAVHGAVVTP